MTTDNQEIQTMVAFGQVVTVRPIPTRQVTQIVIEIPDNHHVAATAMLFGKNAFVLTANPKASIPFGVVPLDKMNDIEGPADAQKGRTTDAPSSVTFRKGGLNVSVDPVRWLGIQCQSAIFMNWIGAKDAQSAAAAARKVCGVESRAEISKNPVALELFMRQIHAPFSAFLRQAENDHRRVTSSMSSAQRTTST